MDQVELLINASAIGQELGSWTTLDTIHNSISGPSKGLRVGWFIIGLDIHQSSVCLRILFLACMWQEQPEMHHGEVRRVYCFFLVAMIYDLAVDPFSYWSYSKVACLM